MTFLVFDFTAVPTSSNTVKILWLGTVHFNLSWMPVTNFSFSNVFVCCSHHLTGCSFGKDATSLKKLNLCCHFPAWRWKTLPVLSLNFGGVIVPTFTRELENINVGWKGKN